MKYYGPFQIEINSKTLSFYLTFTKNKITRVKLNFGQLFIFASKSDFIRFFSNKISNIDPSNNELEYIVTDYFNYVYKSVKLDRLLNRHNLKGINNITKEHVYILGKCYKVTSNSERMKEGEYFYASNYSNLVNSFFEMAKMYFTKRVKILSKQFEFDFDIDVNVSYNLTYLGLNKSKSKSINLDYHLYSFRSEISDSIIIHELAHFLVRNHSKSFYDVVLKACPNYYKYVKIINDGDYLA